MKNRPKIFLANTHYRGITLVEILVVLGLFSGIATIALGALLNTQTINNKLVASQSILDNFNLSLQTITRDMRYGADFHCSTILLTTATTTRRNCPRSAGGGAALNFRVTESSDDNDRVTFYLNEGTLYKKEDQVGKPSVTYQMTGKDVYITTFRVYVDGVHAATDVTKNSDQVLLDYTQPKITLLISGRPTVFKSGTTPVPFSIQTTISPRLIDSI